MRPNKLEQWFIRRQVRKLLKRKGGHVTRLGAFFKGLIQPTTSEFWLGWGGGLLKVVCLSEVGCNVVTSVASLFEMTPQVFTGSLLAIALGRMVSKAAKAGA